MKFRLEYIRSGRLLVVVSVVAASAKLLAETNRVPPSPPALQLQVTSPVEYFRELLAMKPEDREKALASDSPKRKEILTAKIKEYEAMTPEERELRLRMTQLRWYLVPLMRCSPVERSEMLARIPEEDRPLIEKRLNIWDQIPIQVQKDFLENEQYLGYLLKWRGTTAEQQAKLLETFPPERRTRLESELAKWNTLPEERREEMSQRFNQFFDLDEREKSKILGKLSESDREQMQKTLKSLETLPPDQRKQAVEAFDRFAQMTTEERKQFLRNAERWNAMTPAERQAWRAVVQKSQTPPPPPPPMPPGVQRRPAPAPSQSLAKTNAPD